MAYLDYGGLARLVRNIELKYQPKEDGKGLSTNDYTTLEKIKLANLPDAEVITNEEIDALFDDTENSGSTDSNI